ncbi:hypothetical protein [Candidatus Odyssella thessalonicensis]|uniref:hypothetical protein n=1 Tax=Candidatus Odyssella thessalonicensis TaxID=84647 RepID=UPI000225B193|nr:hypothetical protein [Candidatus Odyssella thessalonicensis]
MPHIFSKLNSNNHFRIASSGIGNNNDRHKEKNILGLLKDCVATWPQQELVFSYDLTCLISASGPQLKLRQKQTGFSLTMTVQPLVNGALQVSRFTLKEDLLLEDSCQSLYDAALIELVLQGLVITAFCAQCLQKKRVNLVISAEEAAHLTSLDELFNLVSTHITVDGKRQIFTLSVDNQDFSIFTDRVKTIKICLHQQLWKLQRSDPFLRCYLHHSERQEIPLSQLLVNQKKMEPKITSGTVITFPCILKA